MEHAASSSSSPPHPTPPASTRNLDRMEVTAIPERGVDDRESGSSTPVDSDFCPSDNHSSESEEFDDQGDIRRADCLAWIKELKQNGGVLVDAPPLYIILYEDLFKKWGWERLLPYYKPCHISWSAFKGYLKDYFSNNKDKPATICAQHNHDLVGQDLSADPLHVAASLCIKVEEELLHGCLARLTSEDIQLSNEIKDRARNLIASGGESLTAAAGFVCITKEAELICHLSKLDFDTTGMVAFSNHIRQSALNLLLSEVPESAAAMLGIAKEAMIMHRHLSNELTRKDPDLYVQYLLCQGIRENTATVLTMLEDDFCFETAGDCTPSANSEKPMGIASANELKCQEI